jgi:hypothetical protein
MVSLLAMLLSESKVNSNDREILWPDRLTRLAKSNFQRDMDNLEKLESQISWSLQNWCLDEDWCDLCCLWVTEMKDTSDAIGYLSYDQIIEKTGAEIYCGEFVRMMLKLNNLCKEAVKIALICNKAHIVKVLDNHHRYIIRNIVTPQSLYI